MSRARIYDAVKMFWGSCARTDPTMGQRFHVTWRGKDVPEPRGSTGEEPGAAGISPASADDSGPGIAVA